MQNENNNLSRQIILSEIIEKAANANERMKIAKDSLTKACDHFKKATEHALDAIEIAQNFNLKR